jgi:hypothetical protein
MDIIVIPVVVQPGAHPQPWTAWVLLSVFVVSLIVVGLTWWKM